MGEIRKVSAGPPHPPPLFELLETTDFGMVSRGLRGKPMVLWGLVGP